MDTGGFVGAHRPIHAFYITQPIAPPVQTTHPHHHSTKKHVHTTSLVTTHRSIHVVSTSTPAPIISKSPPLIHQQGQPTLVNTLAQESQPSRDQAWLAPLLGMLGIFSILGTALLFFICKRRRQRKQINNSTEKRLPPSHESWASISTIQTSMLDGDKAKLSPPPAYYSQKAQKRLTADTLVEEPSVLMLKNQYSPQLAFSPSLIAGEFQQQQQEQQPPMPSISPSNTLIDNAGVLNEEKSVGGRPRIEIYDPQVNLQHDDNPYSYTNDQ